MIRNAIGHGLESPEVRRSKGKPPCGVLTLKAYHSAGNIVIQLCDDGAGFNRQRILAKAKAMGLVEDGERLADQDVYRLVFKAGFSTAEKVTDLSGRGVGMDIVRRNIDALRGQIDLQSTAGAGSTVTIRLPLTLAIIEGFGVGVGDQTFVIPVDQIVECVELPEEGNDGAREEGILQLRNAPLPFLYLKDHFGLPGDRVGRQNIVVVQHEGNRAGLAVDKLYGATQTVIKPLPMIFKAIPGVSGSAILGNGRVALILDIPTLLHDFLKQHLQLV
jgi:two-component system chemotaxis sensor kinase CheA